MKTTTHEPSGRPNVFGYGDYRRFLSDSYAFSKAERYGFSVRAFARRARIQSTNYLGLVIAGKRNLSRAMAERFAQGFGLHGAESDFFCELVDYCQAKSTAERTRSHERLARFRQFRAVQKLDAAQTDYHGSWYVPAIRELLRRRDFDEDPRWIARQLLPRISARQAKRALTLLLRLGLVERDADGRLRQAAALVTTGAGPLGHHVFDYHRTMLERAGAALDVVPHDEREVSCITVCVSADAMLQLKQRVRAFRRELLQEAELGNEPERVVQINFQLFPMSVAVQPASAAATARRSTRKRVSKARRGTRHEATRGDGHDEG